MCRYLDDWLIQALSRSLVLQALETVIHLCQDLGVVITWEKYNLLPSQRVVYLGVTLDSTLFRASPSQPRVEKLCLIAEAFLSCSTQPVSLWRQASLWPKSTLFSTSGQMPRMWGGVLTSWTQLLLASGLRWKLSCPTVSLPPLQCVTVFAFVGCKIMLFHILCFLSSVESYKESLENDTNDCMTDIHYYYIKPLNFIC